MLRVAPVTAAGSGSSTALPADGGARTSERMCAAADAGVEAGSDPDGDTRREFNDLEAAADGRPAMTLDCPEGLLAKPASLHGDPT